MVRNIYTKAKSILFDKPEDLYQKDHAVLGRSFYFPGTNGKAVLLIHGWTSVPYEVRRLGMFLNEKGYTVSGPVLKGHGTHPKDLKDVRWEEWLEDVRIAYDSLKKDHQKIYVAGTSMGANLAVMLAKDQPEIAGLVLMAMPHTIRNEKAATWLARVVSIFKAYQKKYYPPSFGDRRFITRLISYQIYPIKSVLEVFRMTAEVRRELPNISQPCLIMQSTSDHIVTKDSLEKIFSEIGSTVKQKKYIDKAYHTFISDIRNEHVFEDIFDFFEEN